MALGELSDAAVRGVDHDPSTYWARAGTTADDPLSLYGSLRRLIRWPWTPSTTTDATAQRNAVDNGIGSTAQVSDADAARLAARVAPRGPGPATYSQLGAGRATAKTRTSFDPTTGPNGAMSPETASVTLPFIEGTDPVAAYAQLAKSAGYRVRSGPPQTDASYEPITPALDAYTSFAKKVARIGAMISFYL